MTKRLLLLVFICLTLFGCSLKEEKEEIFPMGKASNLVKEEELNNLIDVLKKEKVDNIDTFKKWVKDYNKEPIKSTGMLETWTK